MPASDTSEKGLESLIVTALIGPHGEAVPTGDSASMPGLSYSSTGYVLGHPQDYDRDHAVDRAKLLTFLHTTQPQMFAQLGLTHVGPSRLKFLDRLQGEIAKRGVVDVLRKGIKHGPRSGGCRPLLRHALTGQ
jgi:type I restriction enzyme R subunit